MVTSINLSRVVVCVCRLPTLSDLSDLNIISYCFNIKFHIVFTIFCDIYVNIKFVVVVGPLSPALCQIHNMDDAVLNYF